MELKNLNNHENHKNNTLFFSYQILNITKPKPIQLKIKHRSIATLRSPHVDKRGIDQFDYVIYRTQFFFSHNLNTI